MSMQQRLAAAGGALDLRAMLASSASSPVMQTIQAVIAGVQNDAHRAAMSLLCLGARLQVGSGGALGQPQLWLHLGSHV